MAVVRRIATDTAGSVFGPDSDFTAMLADGVPADPDLAAAWNAYAPLRAYLADAKAPTKLTVDELASAAVFTTEKIEDPMITASARVHSTCKVMAVAPETAKAKSTAFRAAGEI